MPTVMIALPGIGVDEPSNFWTVVPSPVTLTLTSPAVVHSSVKFPLGPVIWQAWTIGPVAHRVMLLPTSQEYVCFHAWMVWGVPALSWMPSLS
jgi:hypothetical protein